jgi:glycosyltransferase involved in cell wall biosynthesis
MAMTGSTQVAVLLPTFNGARFLPQQLESLLAQSMPDFVIVTRDDGSSDETLQVVQSFEERFPRQIHRVQDDEGNLGASGNVSLLMQYVLDRGDELRLQEAYLMLCDQDDIWEADKIETELAVMKQLEQQHPNLPLLVHSDLTVISDDESLIAPSFLAYQGLDAARNELRNITFSNTVTGCTALFNRQLAEKALPVPSQAMMHDWWLALVAAAFGHIEFVPQCLVRYRQHSQNTLGASEFIPRKVFSRTTFSQLFRNNPDDLLKAVAGQAEAFFRRYSAEISVTDRGRLRLAGWLYTDSFLLQRILFRLLRF